MSQPFIEKYQKSLKNKTKHKLAKEAYSLKVQFSSEYRQRQETAQSSSARKLLGTASSGGSVPIFLQFSLVKLGFPSFSNKSVKASSHISFGKVQSSG